MLLAGDEIGRTQQGNNNSYCQDNEISWLDWENADEELLAFTSKLIHLRRDHAAFSRKNWFRGEPVKGNGIEDITWFQPDGSKMTPEHWDQDFAKSIAVFLNGQGLHAVNSEGEKVIDDNFYIIFNASDQAIDYKLPGENYAKDWRIIFDTAHYRQEDGEQLYSANEKIRIDGRSVILLQHQLIKNSIKTHA